MSKKNEPTGNGELAAIQAVLEAAAAWYARREDGADHIGMREVVELLSIAVRDYLASCRADPATVAPAMSPQEREVLEAVEAWRSDGDWPRTRERLMKAAVALHISRQPAGMCPVTVEPGARFRFVPGPGEGGTGLCDLYALGPRRLWSMHGDAELYDFREGDRIIPIPEDQ